MTALEMTAAFLGGLGLFLLGMSLLADGLKLAGGRALRHIRGGLPLSDLGHSFQPS
jgi:Na+/phosphate symporter